MSNQNNYSNYYQPEHGSDSYGNNTQQQYYSQQQQQQHYSQQQWQQAADYDSSFNDKQSTTHEQDASHSSSSRHNKRSSSSSSRHHGHHHSRSRRDRDDYSEGDHRHSRYGTTSATPIADDEEDWRERRRRSPPPHQRYHDFDAPQQSNNNNNNHSRNRSRSTDREDRPTNTLMLSNVPKNMDVESLTYAIKSYTPVEEVAVLGSGRARVLFATVTAASAFLDSMGDSFMLNNQRVAMRYTGAVRSQRSMDWLCGGCGGDNFARRTLCFTCGAPRTEDSVVLTRPIGDKNRSSRGGQQGGVYMGGRHTTPASAPPRQPAQPVRASEIPAGYVRDASGYHFNAETGHYFDQATSYYFILDRPNQRYLFFDDATSTYKVYPPQWPSTTPSNTSTTTTNNTSDNNNNNSNTSAAVSDTSHVVPATTSSQHSFVHAVVAPPRQTASVARADQTKKSTLDKAHKPVKLSFSAKKAASNIAKWEQAKKRKEREEAERQALPFFVQSGAVDDDAADGAHNESDAATAAGAAGASSGVRSYRSVGRASEVNSTPLGRRLVSPHTPALPVTAAAAAAAAAASMAGAVSTSATAAAATMAAVGASSEASTRAALAASSPLKFLKTGRVACTLCRRQFADAAAGEKHVNLSELHQRNVAAAIEAAREADELKAKAQADRERAQKADRELVRQRQRDAREEMLATERRLAERAALKAQEARERHARRVAAGEAGADAVAADLDADQVDGPRIGTDNIGNRMLKKMGWKEGEGLGRDASGITAPVRATGSSRGAGGIGTRGRSTPVAGSSYRESLYARAASRFDEVADATDAANAKRLADQFAVQEAAFTASLPPLKKKRR